MVKLISVPAKFKQIVNYTVERKIFKVDSFFDEFPQWVIKRK